MHSVTHLLLADPWIKSVEQWVFLSCAPASVQGCSGDGGWLFPRLDCTPQSSRNVHVLPQHRNNINTVLVVVMALLSIVVVVPPTSHTADPVFTAFTTLPFSLSSTWEELPTYQPPRSEFFWDFSFLAPFFFLGVKVMCILKLLVWLDSGVL